MPDQGPIAISIHGKDHVYDEVQQAWVPAPVGTPHWRELIFENPPWPTRQLPPSREVDRHFARFLIDAKSRSAFARRMAKLRDDDYRRLGAA